MDKILSLLYFHKLKKIELSVCDLSIPKVSKFYLILPVIFHDQPWTTQQDKF